MPFHSVETRWFFQGELDPEGEVVRAFRALPLAPVAEDVPAATWPEEWREDTYLVLRGESDLGIKWRGEGPACRFEVKGKVGSVDEAEHWVKWSNPGDSLPHSLERFRAHDPAAAQIRVRKKRLLRKYALDPEEGPREVALHLFPDRGLMMELTRLEVGGRPFWTLGIEAFPGDVDWAAECAPLARAGVGILPRELGAGAGDRLSYPAWLQRFLPPE